MSWNGNRTLRLTPPIRLAKTCLIYLGSNAFDTPCADKATFQIRVKKYKFSHYASQYWADHIRGDAKSEKEIQNAILGTFRLASKRESMNQMNMYAESSWGKFILYTGMSLLHVIAANGLAMVCRRLLDGISMTTTGMFNVLFVLNWMQSRDRTDKHRSEENDGSTALNLAASNGHVDVVKLLLNANANIETEDKSGRTPLSWAAAMVTWMW